MNNKVKNSIPYITVKLNDLLVWDKNPRYSFNFPTSFEISYDNDEKIVKDLINKESEELVGDEHNNKNNNLKSFQNLIFSILANGFDPNISTIWVKKINEKYLVLDGNRRVAAMKIINWIKGESQITWIKNIFSNDIIMKVKKTSQSFNSITDVKDFTRVDATHIKTAIHREEQKIQNGKKFWTRIVRYSQYRESYKQLEHEGYNKEEIFKKLVITFDKPIDHIEKSFKSIWWLFSLFESANILPEEYLKFEVSAIENARSTIIDPKSKKKISELFTFSLNNKNSFDIEKINDQRLKERNFKEFAIFLCNSFKKGYFTTRGWKSIYDQELVLFLYDNHADVHNTLLKIKISELEKILKKPNNELPNELIEEIENNKNSINNVINSKNSMLRNNTNILNIVYSLNRKRQEFYEVNKGNITKPENNIIVHFYSLIDMLYHELSEDYYIKHTNIKKFPFNSLSLLFRNILFQIISIFFIHAETRKKFITILNNKNPKLQSIEICKGWNNKPIDISDLEKQFDLTAPTAFFDIDLIKKSIFYRCNGSICTFFCTNGDEQKKEIKYEFIKNFSLLFNCV